jgi:signal transduction histidine kinase
MGDNALSYEDLLAELAELRTQVAALNASQETLSTYLGIVVHDLKQPLGLIVGYSEFLLEVYGDEVDEEVRRDLGVIAQRGRLTTQMTEEMLPLCTAAAGSLELKPLDMAALFARALQRLENVTATLNLEVVTPLTWPPALGTEFLIEQVWVKVLSTALRFPRQQPHLRVEVGGTPLANGQVGFWLRCQSGAASATPPDVTALLSFPVTEALERWPTLTLAHYIVAKLGGEVTARFDAEASCGVVVFTLSGS